MQAKYKFAFAVATGFFLGAGAIHGLHAAASPPAYVINEITVKDEDGYKKDFLPGRKRPSMTMAANTSLAGSIRLFR
jgi:hypothetical protein